MDELNIEPNKKKTSKKAKLFFIFLSALILIGLNVLLGVKFFHLVENGKNTKVVKEVAKKEAIDLIEDDDTRDMAEEFSSLSGLAETVGLQGIKYQLTGKYKDINI